MTKHLSMRDLQKISAEAIAALDGATPIKSGDRTVALLIPLKPADPRRMRAWAEEVEALAKERDRDLDDQVLREAGADLTDWTLEAVERFRADLKRER